MGAGWFDMGAGWFDMGAGWVDRGGGGAPIFPTRADRPLADFKIPPNPAATFGKDSKRWDPDLFALSILPEFFSIKDATDRIWKDRIDIPAPAPLDSQAMLDELQQVIILGVTERPQSLSEIIQQDQNMQLCWLQLLMITRHSHPATYLIMKLAARVGEAVMVYYKLQLSRARPSQVCATLYPPLPVPGHSSYPAGHSLIGYLTSYCLRQVVKDAGVKDALLELAKRVSDNRVIAGLHFPSDMDAGKKGADGVF